MFERLRFLLRRTNWKEFQLRRGRCLVCDRSSLFFKLDATEWTIGCMRCRANVVATGIIAAVKDVVSDWKNKSFYELSARGSVVDFLQNHIKCVTVSEYFDDVPSGQYQKGVQCQDVQDLTYADESFDVCTSSEVFEHVPDDRRGFKEIHRVLRPGGNFIFSVPISDASTTRERASVEDGQVIHHLPAEYHDDPFRGRGKVLCYRDYGTDIIDRLTDSGFSRATLVTPKGLNPWDYTRRIAVAYKDRTQP